MTFSLKFRGKKSSTYFSDVTNRKLTPRPAAPCKLVFLGVNDMSEVPDAFSRLAGHMSLFQNNDADMIAVGSAMLVDEQTGRIVAEYSGVTLKCGTRERNGQMYVTDKFWEYNDVQVQRGGAAVASKGVGG